MADVKQELPMDSVRRFTRWDSRKQGAVPMTLADLLALLPLLGPEQKRAATAALGMDGYREMASHAANAENARDDMQRERDAAIKRADHYENLWQENHEHKDRAFTERNVARRRVEVLEEELAAAVKRAEEATKDRNTLYENSREVLAEVRAINEGLRAENEKLRHLNQLHIEKTEQHLEIIEKLHAELGTVEGA